MKKSTAFLAILTASAFMLAGCQGGTTATGTQTAGDSAVAVTGAEVSVASDAQDVSAATESLSDLSTLTDTTVAAEAVADGTAAGAEAAGAAAAGTAAGEAAGAEAAGEAAGAGTAAGEAAGAEAAGAAGAATAAVIPLHVDTQQVLDSPEWVTNLESAKDESVKQLFVVAGIGMDQTTASVSMHERDADGNWKQVLSTPAFVGKNGLCLDADHAEGCAQTPIGVYHFNKAFGIAADPGCAIPYIQVTDDTYWSGDTREGMHYNEMVDIKDYPDLVMDDSEHIVDYEYQYQYCLNISFNEEGTPGRGSAIFLHCFGPTKPWTGGCVAIPENMMKMVMQRVTPECVVVIDTLENMNGSL